MVLTNCQFTRLCLALEDLLHLLKDTLSALHLTDALVDLHLNWVILVELTFVLQSAGPCPQRSSC